MMDISTPRFYVKSNGVGGVTIRDKNAPYHCHTAPIGDVPPVHTMALMSERQFDTVISGLIYGGKS